MTGIIDAFAKHGRHVILDWCKKGYAFLRKLDEEISSFFCIPQSIKLTTVKPSGTVSLLAGALPRNSLSTFRILHSKDLNCQRFGFDSVIKRCQFPD